MTVPFCRPAIGYRCSFFTTGTSANNSGGSKLAFLVVPHDDSVVEVGVVGHMAGDGSIIAENGSFN